MPYESRLEFVDFQLTVKQKEEMKAWYEKVRENFDPIVSFVNSGYKVVINWEDRNQCFVVFVFPTKKDDYNQGATLTSRSDDWYKAVVSAWYKHEIIKKGRWWIPKETKPSDQWDW